MEGNELDRIRDLEARYGLVLSIISVIKLIIIDISYDNLALRAASFLVCGLLCFAISYIYNKLDKNNKVG